MNNERSGCDYDKRNISVVICDTDILLPIKLVLFRVDIFEKNLGIELSFLIRFTASNFFFGIFKHFFLDS
jgi:hypothetical protein